MTYKKKLTRGEVCEGQKLWSKAKGLIPGGNMLLSKRPEMFLPDIWPAYFSRSKGCAVWDLDGGEYTDLSIMGIGTNTLGYGHFEVDEAVIQAVKSGNMSTFNCPEEVELAERLTDLHPWADMARFARSGGEANAIAIRIARAASAKDGVAICGYHGWHDWYLAANLSNDQSLDGHLLPGLSTSGVPRDLAGSVHAFNYNDIDELRQLVNRENIGVIKMEVTRNLGPSDQFLKKVRSLCDDKDIVLIFDECTSGFRQSFGGIHKIFDVEPDMATFGKALGNGYAISAVIGRRSIMEEAQNTFISSTFWTERIGPVAALKTLEVMERTKSWEQITETGKVIQKEWARISSACGVPITITGIPAIPSYVLQTEKNQIFRTFMTQLMLEKGFLSTPLVYVSLSHTDEILQNYFTEFEACFQLAREALADGTIDMKLKGPICHSGFKRLN